ncbi:hypothetical protein [Deinococcus hopiensis]|uniref:Spore coat protein U domain-containing protein n=1 Tax=Deinococcus hopiensis KR-140 TaxID=695939 RepID=A0A1W1UDR2_9DEIO|nr:hypothetical protein [Deinococcus hopiensis]SMB79246.1 hypothetical protein SAMN00790413_05852 [Deinococcus hopiensis KR-140]
MRAWPGILLGLILSAASVAGAGTATFDPSTNAKTSTSEQSEVSVTVGRACVLGKPADIILSTIYWTGTADVTDSTTFTVQCNEPNNTGFFSGLDLSMSPNDSVTLVRVGASDPPEDTDQLTVNLTKSPLNIDFGFDFDETNTAPQTFTVTATLSAGQIGENHPAGVYEGTVTISIDFPF